MPTDEYVKVSIRAPHFHAGRPLHISTDTAADLFQSAPRTFMRGDAPRHRRSPGLLLFQSAPRTFMRGDLLRRVYRRRVRSFNPRPALSCGATKKRAVRNALQAVSIRAPHFHAGRRASEPRPARWRGFNPRPALSCGATRTCPARSPSSIRFNPRPALSCGATHLQDAANARLFVSIRAPHFHAGRRQRSQ